MDQQPTAQPDTHTPAASGAPADEAQRVEALQEELGHRFADIELLRRALTHRSHAHEQRVRGDVHGEHNERLEFLGDAVVNLCAGALLMEALPGEREGRLTKLRAMVVTERSLARAARALGLGAHLRLGHGEAMAGGHDKDSLLSDAFEAVGGALFLDAGFEAAERVLRRVLAPLVKDAVEGELDRDYKGRLQERTQAMQGETPVYVLAATHGPDHDRRFVMAVRLDGRELARAEGRSKKAAAQAAARTALEALDRE